MKYEVSGSCDDYFLLLYFSTIICCQVGRLRHLVVVAAKLAFAEAVVDHAPQEVGSQPCAESASGVATEPIAVASLTVVRWHVPIRRVSTLPNSSLCESFASVKIKNEKVNIM